MGLKGDFTQQQLYIFPSDIEIYQKSNPSLNNITLVHNYLLYGFHEPDGSSHITPEAVWVTEVLMAAHVVERVQVFYNYLGISLYIFRNLNKKGKNESERVNWLNKVLEFHI